MTPSQACVDLVDGSEALRLVAYLDEGKKGIWTIGLGHTKGVKEGDTCTKEQAVAWRIEELGEAARDVNGLVKVELKQREFDALCSLVYNCGGGAFRESTMLRLLNQGDRLGAAMQFQDWSLDDGVRSAGLLKRRLREALVFLG